VGGRRLWEISARGRGRRIPGSHGFRGVKRRQVREEGVEVKVFIWRRRPWILTLSGEGKEMFSLNLRFLSVCTVVPVALSAVRKKEGLE
jgi:hypothetical protein